MTTLGIISIVVAVIVALGGVILNFYKINKISEENEYKNVINSQKGDLSDFRKEVSDLHKKIENLNTIIRELDAALIRSNAISLSFPFPFWYKSSDGKMRMLNDEYCKTYLKRREDYIGKTDKEVWDNEKALQFMLNDEKTLNSSKGYTINYDEEVDDTIVIKWRIPGLTKDESYIAGIAVPYNFIEDVKSRNTQ
jgi:hypothetical protein